MTVDDSWEARMAKRAQLLQRKADRERIRRMKSEEYDEVAQRPWLNGWPRFGLYQVIIGSGTHCVGCGRCGGVICVSIPSDWEPPGPEPTWPFTPADCPVCNQ